MDIRFFAIKGGFVANHRNVTEYRDAQLHYHCGYELYYLIDGQRNYLTQSKLYPLKKNWITLTRPLIIHGTTGKEYERLLISFSEDFLSTYFQPSLIEIFHEVFSLDTIPASIIEENPNVKELFWRIIREYERGNIKMAAMQLGELLLILHEIIQQIPVETNNSTLPTQMQEILEYISNNLSTVKTLEQVASHFYVSKYYLSHQFKSSVGLTFIEFLTKVKLSRHMRVLRRFCRLRSASLWRIEAYAVSLCHSPPYRSGSDIPSGGRESSYAGQP